MASATILSLIQVGRMEWILLTLLSITCEYS